MTKYDRLSGKTTLNYCERKKARALARRKGFDDLREILKENKTDATVSILSVLFAFDINAGTFLFLSSIFYSASLEVKKKWAELPS